MSGKEKEKFLLFKETKNYKNFKFRNEELDKVKIDLTFNKQKIGETSNLTPYENPALQAVDYIKNSLVYFPEIKFILFLVKRILKIAKLNSSYNGKLTLYKL